MGEMHYHDYLQLDKILNAQFPESNKKNLTAHDEMLFIIIHQAYELWFKQLHHEVDSINIIMKKPAMNDNSPELQTVVHRLNRITTILRVLVQQVDIMETMTPMDFLDFRDLLRPASGFQSWQFKMLEAKLGLKFEYRHGKEYYTSQLRKEHVDLIKETENNQSLLQLPFQLLNLLLEIDEQLSNWRYRHMNMVHRMIGTRIGTGGSSGKDYLKSAADKHYIFKEIAHLTSFLMERGKIPQLPEDVERELGFKPI